MTGYVWHDPNRRPASPKRTLAPLTPEEAKVAGELNLRVQRVAWAAAIQRLESDHRARYSPEGRCEALLAALDLGHVDPKRRAS